MRRPVDLIDPEVHRSGRGNFTVKALSPISVKPPATFFLDHCSLAYLEKARRFHLPKKLANCSKDIHDS